jgi:hypothetical protein
MALRRLAPSVMDAGDVEDDAGAAGGFLGTACWAINRGRPTTSSTTAATTGASAQAREARCRGRAARKSIFGARFSRNKRAASGDTSDGC